MSFHWKVQKEGFTRIFIFPLEFLSIGINIIVIIFSPLFIVFYFSDFLHAFARSDLYPFVPEELVWPIQNKFRVWHPNLKNYYFLGMVTTAVFVEYKVNYILLTKESLALLEVVLQAFKFQPFLKDFSWIGEEFS